MTRSSDGFLGALAVLSGIAIRAIYDDGHVLTLALHAAISVCGVLIFYVPLLVLGALVTVYIGRVKCFRSKLVATAIIACAIGLLLMFALPII